MAVEQLKAVIATPRLPEVIVAGTSNHTIATILALPIVIMKYCLPQDTFITTQPSDNKSHQFDSYGYLLLDRTVPKSAIK